MPCAVSSSEALPRRRIVRSHGNGTGHGCTDFIGRHAHGESSDGPEAFLVDMSPGEVILPHFHEVDQYQVFLKGDGRFGRRAVCLPAVHYVDRCTGYGPIRAAAGGGYSYFVLHAERDPGAVYRHRPDYRSRLRPGRRRHRLVDGLAPSAAAALRARTEPARETVLDDGGFGDGLGACLIRVGPGQEGAATSSAATGGQFILVLNGSLELDGGEYPPWSPVYLSPGEPPLKLRAGAGGLEALVLDFPRRSAAA